MFALVLDYIVDSHWIVGVAVVVDTAVVVVVAVDNHHKEMLVNLAQCLL